MDIPTTITSTNICHLAEMAGLDPLRVSIDQVIEVLWARHCLQNGVEYVCGYSMPEIPTETIPDIE